MVSLRFPIAMLKSGLTVIPKTTTLVLSAAVATLRQGIRVALGALLQGWGEKQDLVSIKHYSVCRGSVRWRSLLGPRAPRCKSVPLYQQGRPRPSCCWSQCVDGVDLSVLTMAASLVTE